MNPLARKGAELAIVAELRKIPPPANLTELRLALGLTAAEALVAVHALRFAGKLKWDKLELSPSMLAGDDPAQGSAGAPPVEEGGAELQASAVEAPPSGPDDPDDYPGEVNDTAASELQAPVDGRRHNTHNAAGHDGGFVPKRLAHAAGVHAANTRAATRPVAVPEHEPEVARQVREETEETLGRRRWARSTATVSQPLEIRKFGKDLDFTEGLQTLLVERPQDLMRAIERRHPALWRRVILLGRGRGERPGQALYAALEAGLAALEPQPSSQEAA